MDSQGFIFEKAEVLSVSDIVSEQNQKRCYVEAYNQMTMNGMRIKSKSYLLGVFDETQKHWYFIEAKQLKNVTLVDSILPNFETQLEIPDDELTTEPI